VDIKDLPSYSNQPKVGKPSTLEQIFHTYAITKRMLGQQKFPVAGKISLSFNQLHDPQFESFIGTQRNRQISKTLGTNWDLFKQIKVWKARLLYAVLASFLEAAYTGDCREDFGVRFTVTNYKRWITEVKIKI
jgi:hypothetical protein